MPRAPRFASSSAALFLAAASVAACSGDDVDTDGVPVELAARPATDGGPEAAATTPPIATGVHPQIASTLAAAGVSLDALPDLETLKQEPGLVRLKAVMKTFSMSLGTNCFGCHAGSATTGADFAAETPRKKVARAMWVQFVTRLQTRDAKPIYCDTCHQGRTTFLERGDPAALKSWMRGNFVGALARKDGASHTCATCHGAPFVGPLVDGWQQ